MSSNLFTRKGSVRMSSPAQLSSAPLRSAQVICLRSSLIPMGVPNKEKEVKWPQSSGLCADFWVSLKLAPWGLKKPTWWGKKASFQSTKKAMCTKEATHRGTLVERNEVPMECASFFSLPNIDTRCIFGYKSAYPLVFHVRNLKSGEMNFYPQS